jgi:hypothetical protein
LAWGTEHDDIGGRQIGTGHGCDITPAGNVGPVAGQNRLTVLVPLDLCNTFPACGFKPKIKAANA